MIDTPLLAKALELAAHITNPVSAAMFAAVIVFGALYILSSRRGRIPTIAWMLCGFIFVLGVSPLVAKLITEYRGIYRVRIEVLEPDGQAVHDAAITSSVGGELYKTDAGWEFIIPPQSRPSDNTVTFRASEPNAFLAGSSTLQLASDYYPTISLRLAPLPTVITRGIVVDPRGHAIPGVRVWVEGYDDAVTTSDTGSFSLPSHAADGQQITIRAEKGDETAQTLGIAGRTTEIVLRP